MGKNKDKKKPETDAEESMQEEASVKESAEEAAEEIAEEAEAAEPEETEEDGSSEEETGKEPDAEEGSEEKEDPKDKKIAELNDKVVRQMAEFDNFRKRTEKEKAETFANGEKAVIEAILPVIDNFERALDMAGQDEEKKDDPFIEGMDKVYRQLIDELEKLGVKPIEALGADFDPNLHNAVMQEETEEFESGKVCKELQKGYTLNDSVVRHSMVSVAQ
ncbi:MAG: nucleotide exchange factor GrpE [Lachnospiraceae bacterium]|nr:nucleotide exchange factor GrpE [Lachnospiraceae bacterium]